MSPASSVVTSSTPRNSRPSKFRYPKSAAKRITLIRGADSTGVPSASSEPARRETSNGIVTSLPLTCASRAARRASRTSSRRLARSALRETRARRRERDRLALDALHVPPRDHALPALVQDRPSSAVAVIAPVEPISAYRRAVEGDVHAHRRRHGGERSRARGLGQRGRRGRDDDAGREVAEERSPFHGARLDTPPA